LEPEKVATVARRLSANSAAAWERCDSRNSLQRDLPNSSHSDFDRRIGCLGKKAEHQAIFVNFADVGLGAGCQQERRVACGGIAQQAVFQIDKEISGGDEVLFELAAEGAIQSGEDARGIVGVGSLAGEGDFEHGGDEGSGNAMAGDVGD